MTANEFVRRIQAKVSMLSTGDIPIKLNGKDIECVIELIENGKGYYINIKQPTKDLALTIEDLELLHTFLYAVKNNKQGCFTFTRLSDEQYQEVLKRFNEQRKK